MTEPVTRVIEGPSFEDLEPGIEFDSPGITRALSALISRNPRRCLTGCFIP